MEIKLATYNFKRDALELELSINYIYKLPFPRERIDLNIVSASSSASSTPVKSPMPTQPTGRPAKVTKINFD